MLNDHIVYMMIRKLFQVMKTYKYSIFLLSSVNNIHTNMWNLRIYFLI